MVCINFVSATCMCTCFSQYNIMKLEVDHTSSKRNLYNLHVYRVGFYFAGGFFFATDTPYLAFGSLYFCGTEKYTHDLFTEKQP